jgi:HPt (histidine-containing phosphotransfer) domain-containing protein
MDDYLSKPIELTRLVVLLEKWLYPEGAMEKSEHSAEQDVEAQPKASLVELSIFDEADYMRRNLEDRDLAQEVLNMFVASTPGYLTTLQNQLDSRNAAEIRMQAHTIKGACATVGAELMRTTAQRVEQLAKDGELEAAASVAERLLLDYQRLKEELRRRGWLQQ